MYGCFFGRLTNPPLLGAVPCIFETLDLPPQPGWQWQLKVVGWDALLEMIDTGHGSIKLPISGGAETMVKKYGQKRIACL